MTKKIVKLLIPIILTKNTIYICKTFKTFLKHIGLREHNCQLDLKDIHLRRNMHWHKFQCTCLALEFHMLVGKLFHSRSILCVVVSIYLNLIELKYYNEIGLELIHLFFNGIHSLNAIIKDKKGYHKVWNILYWSFNEF